MKKFDELIDLMEQIKFLCGSSHNKPYFTKRIKEYIEGLFERFCPFRVGDRVVLSKTPIITKEKSWGWKGSKHFLKKGAAAVIREIDYCRGKFVYGLIFDNETWWDSTNKIARPINQKHIYTFSEDYIEKSPDKDFHLEEKL